MSGFDPDALRSELEKSYGTVIPGVEEKLDHGTIFKNLDEFEKKSKGKKETTARSPVSYFQDPGLALTSAVLAPSTAIAQHVTPPREAQLAASKLRKEAAEYVRTGQVPPSGLHPIQTYAASQQNVIPAQNINPVLSTPSNVQTRLVTPLTEGTERVLQYAPNVEPIPGSEIGLVHEGTPASRAAVENNPLLKTAKVNAPAVGSGSATAEQLAALMENMNPQQRKTIESLLQKGYAVPDLFKKIFGKIAVPAAVASVPEEAASAWEAYKKGDYPRMVSSGLGAVGGAALGAGAGLGALALAPELAGGLALTGGLASLAPVAHAVYDYLNPTKP